MDETTSNEKDNDPGLTFTEIFPGTYYTFFTRYDKDKKKNTAQARFYLEQVKKALAKHPGEKVNFINDTSLVGNQVFSLSSEAKKYYLEAYSQPGVGQVAEVGFSPWLKKFISILAHLAGRSQQTAVFDTREEAIEWIKKTS